MNKLRDYLFQVGNGYLGIKDGCHMKWYDIEINCFKEIDGELWFSVKGEAKKVEPWMKFIIYKKIDEVSDN